MEKSQQQVREFHAKVLAGPTSPAEPKLRNPHLRARLILEEAIETAFALVGARDAATIVQEQLLHVQQTQDMAGEPDLVEALDGVCDTIVVCLGTAEDIGVDLEPFMDEVMRSNMAKAGGAVRADGKKLKPPGWTPPDVAGVLRKMLEERKEAEESWREVLG